MENRVNRPTGANRSHPLGSHVDSLGDRRGLGLVEDSLTEMPASSHLPAVSLGFNPDVGPVGTALMSALGLVATWFGPIGRPAIALQPPASRDTLSVEWNTSMPNHGDDPLRLVAVLGGVRETAGVLGHARRVLDDLQSAVRAVLFAQQTQPVVEFEDEFTITLVDYFAVSTLNFVDERVEVIDRIGHALPVERLECEGWREARGGI